MSTHAQIGFYKSQTLDINKPNVLIYKHSDGYPEGVTKLLTKFCREFEKSHGLSDVDCRNRSRVWAAIHWVWNLPKLP